MTSFRRGQVSLAPDVNMDGNALEVHSYILKIWIERAASADSGTTWRGTVTHVPSGERIHFEELRVAVEFIARNLESLGLKPDRR